MKIGFFNRLAVIISALVLVALSALIIATALNLIPLDTIGEMTRRLYEVEINYWPTLGAGAFILMLSAVMFALAFKRGNRAPKKQEPKYIDVGTPDGGQIKIANTSLCQMICKSVDEIPGIKESKARINVANEQAHIIVGVSLNPGVVVPEVGELIQTTTKERIEKLTGLDIQEITVLVNNKDEDKA